MGGTQLHPLTAPPNMAKNVQKVLITFGVNLPHVFAPYVCVLKISWGIQICMQNMKNCSDPWTPPNPAPLTCLLGPDPYGVKFSFQKLHICVLEMIGATRGSIWGMYVGVPRTSAQLPSQPPLPPEGRIGSKLADMGVVSSIFTGLKKGFFFKKKCTLKIGPLEKRGGYALKNCQGNCG